MSCPRRRQPPPPPHLGIRRSTPNRRGGDRHPVVLALTGASGAPYGVRLLEVLARRRCRCGSLPRATACGSFMTSAASNAGWAARGRTGGDWRRSRSFPTATGARCRPRARSGRSGMVMCPCSMGTVAAIAAGTSRSLVERAADVTLKERRKLILVPRETPLSLVHLRNLVAVTEAGAVVIPAAPGFYHRPTTGGRAGGFHRSARPRPARISTSRSPGAGRATTPDGADRRHRGHPRSAPARGVRGIPRGRSHPARGRRRARRRFSRSSRPSRRSRRFTATPTAGRSAAGSPQVATVELDGFSIVVTHGDQLGSPTPERLQSAFPNAEIIVYGHTHRPLLTLVDVVVTVMNPGGAGPRRFDLPASVGILELEPGIPPRGRLVPLTPLDPD